MAAALDWREAGPPAGARPRGRARPGAGHVARARSWGSCCGAWRRRRSPARLVIAPRLWSSPGPCGRIPRRDRRLRGVRGGKAPRRAGGPRARLPGLPHGRGLRLDRAGGAHRGGVRVAGARVRPSSAGGGGRDQRPSAAEDRGLRQHGAAGAEDRALRGSHRDHRARRDPGVPGRGLRDHRAPRPGERPARGARAPRGESRDAEGGPGRRGPRDRGQGRGRLPAGARRPRGGHRGAGDGGVLRRPAGPHRAHLPAQARGARVLPRRRAAGGARGPAGARALRHHPARGAHVLPRRERSPASRPRAARELPRPAHERARAPT